MSKNMLEITIPVYNEENDLEPNITKLLSFCKSKLDSYDFMITIADNASTDNTGKIGQSLAKRDTHIQYVYFTQKGRGRAVKTVWQESHADYCCYMDIDLSTDLSFLPLLLESLKKGNDIAIGSRLLPSSKVIERSLKREFISRMYNIVIKIMFQTRFSDAQCGFKAITRTGINTLLRWVRDDEWFMDTELLILAEKAGYNIYELPVIWHDNPGSTVRVLPTAMGDLRGLLRLFFSRPWENIKKRGNG